MAGSYAAYAGYAFWRSLRRPPVAPEERTDFKAQSVARLPTPETYKLHGEGEAAAD